MRAGVIDVGSNTARLLVARRGTGVVVPVHEERALLALGDEIERFGRISDLKLAETAERSRRYAQRARELGCRSLAVIVTALDAGARTPGPCWGPSNARRASPSACCRQTRRGGSPSTERS